MVVTTALDVVDEYDGVISLREAILYANEGTRAEDGTPTITFDSSLGNDIKIELDPELGDIVIPANLYEKETLKIQGLEKVTIRNGKFENGVIFVDSGNHAAFHDIDFTNNSATAGAAVFNNKGYVTFANNVFSGNSAEKGGAIVNRGDMTLSDAIFSNNKVSAANEQGIGGAVYNAAGSMTLHQAVFQNNSANGRGGAIYNYSNAGVTLSSATFSGNSARNDGGAIYNNSGSMTLSSATFSGNSAMWGGAIYNNGGRMTLSSATFSGNSAAYSGGAIHNYDYGSMTLSSAAFSGNSAGDHGGAIRNTGSMTLGSASFCGNSARYSGGAINNAGSMTLGSATFSGNSAQNGGAIYNYYYGSMTLSSATFSGNLANNGGAIYNNGGRMTLSSATFSGNSAAWDGEGGAIYNAATITISNAKFETASDTIYNTGNMTLTGSISLATNLFTTNTITATNANIAFDISSYTKENATAIISDISKISGANSWSITVDAAQTIGTYKLASNASGFTGSMSVKTDDSTLIQSLTIDGEAVTVNEVSYALKHDASNLVLTITGKPVVELDWTWSINANGKLEVATEAGYTVSYATVSEPATWTPYTTPLNPITGTYYFKAENGIITAKNEIVGYVGQSALNGGAIYNTSSRTLGNAYFLRNSAQYGYGGAIDNVGSMTLNSAAFSGNSAHCGGAIYNVGSMTLGSATFSGNSAGYDGGAIYNSYGSMTLSSTTFSGNSARYSGGVIWNNQSMTLNSAAFSGNSAHYGGAIYNYGSMTLSSATFSGNYAGFGGAIFNDGCMTLSSATFSGNYAGFDGGAIRNDGSMTLSSATFSGNSALHGGAIFNDSSMTLDNATFSGNSAGDKGGAIYNWYGCRITLNSATFSGNSAKNGGAIYNDSDSTITINNAKFETVSDTIYNVGSMTFVGLVSLAANLYTTTTITATDAILMFDISSYKAANETVIVSDISKIDGADYAICVDTDQTYASYKLAGNANNFAETITIKNTAGNEVGTISVGDTLKVEDTIYKLNVTDSNLVFTVSSATADETAPILSGWQVRDTVFASAMDNSQVASLQYKVDGSANWKTYNASTGVKVTSANSQIMFKATDTMGNSSDILLNINQNLLPSASDAVTVGAQQVHWDLSNDEQHNAKVTIQDEEKTLSFNTKDENVSILGGGGMQIKVEDSQGKSLGKLDLESTIPAGAEDKPVEMDAGEADGVTDIFIARTNGIWEEGYAAKHLGYLKEGELFAGTSENIALAGRNKISDIFNGAEDANVLLLTDDSNGDSLFVEDVYSESTGDLGKTQSRIAQIKEIYAGAGNDIVDMTSQIFEYTGKGITVHGGSGDDTIWSAYGENKLFGDAGDDRIVGASGNDVIVGGAGNDSMHGGGGSDIFCFCDDWGTDTVEQLSNGTVTLWFESGSASKWDKTTMTYTDGNNSVAVKGVTDVTLKFGDDKSDLYKELVALDAFAEKSSEKVFEEKDKSLITTVK